jgi:hypothetical protein
VYSACLHLQASGELSSVAPKGAAAVGRGHACRNQGLEVRQSSGATPTYPGQRDSCQGGNSADREYPRAMPIHVHCHLQLLGGGLLSASRSAAQTEEARKPPKCMVLSSALEGMHYIAALRCGRARMYGHRRGRADGTCHVMARHLTPAPGPFAVRGATTLAKVEKAT